MHLFGFILLSSNLLCYTLAIIITKCINDKNVALTFDDGPSIKTTNKLLDLLESYGVKGTFHVVTKHFNYPEVQNIMKEIISRGHVLGYRVEAEWELVDVSKEGVQGAVEYRLEMIKKASGKKPKFVRTSYNATDLVKDSLVASGLIVTVPNFETYDYKSDFSTDSMINSFESTPLRSVISVQREFSSDLFETTAKFIDYLNVNNFKIVTLQECTGIDEIYFDEKPISPFKPIKNDEVTEVENLEEYSTSGATLTVISYTSLYSFCLLYLAVQLL